jgi:hypothetical protein
VGDDREGKSKKAKGKTQGGERRRFRHQAPTKAAPFLIPLFAFCLFTFAFRI